MHACDNVKIDFMDQVFERIESNLTNVKCQCIRVFYMSGRQTQRRFIRFTLGVCKIFSTSLRSPILIAHKHEIVRRREYKNK